MFFKMDDRDDLDKDTNPENLVTSRLVPKSPSEAIKPMVAAPPPEEIKSDKKGGFLFQFSGFLNFLLIMFSLGVLLINILDENAQRPGPLANEKVISIPKGSGVNVIANILYREGAISSPLLFNMQVFMEQKRSKFRPGEFNFKPHMSLKEVMDYLINGQAILYSITIPEGLTSQQIVQRILDNDFLSGDITDIPAEGSLLPETYKFERGMLRKNLILKMQRDHKKVVEQIWKRRAVDLPIKTKEELVILASIVEKETGRADERTRVAAVFMNRLNAKMKLQSDPTIVYGLVGGKGTLGRGILRSEILKPTPYNTYVIDGLPPTAIANPGRAALEAVANPSRTKDLYFVSDGAGGHVFAGTYEQHLKNVLRWRLMEKNRAESGKKSLDHEVDRSTPIDEVEAAQKGDGFQGEAEENHFDDTQLNSDIKSPQRSRAFDASEGTNFDPLADKAYDLDSPQDVPALIDNSSD